ncbi:MAG: tRNA (adenosine(37)-N6)-threonylcarbamoyltransferase complex ATPase subunit type 1 TsaE [Xanthomonadales bacterium]|nr:tRNA (adenosine(37)-N6)-threonylcarbamoyltransferase complex ATPase subunit type 1 TsaE [Xanthomonadales bacterium]
MKRSDTTEPAWVRNVANEQAVAELAGEFASNVQAPLVIYLQGDLGAGKTTFARAYIHALGYQGYVKSPSYGLLETYRAGEQDILHLDLYRIEDPEELEYLALRDLYTDTTVLLVEWPDRGKHYLPEPDLLLDFGEKDEVRFVACHGFSDAGETLARAISSQT